jgi:hypothetical protein
MSAILDATRMLRLRLPRLLVLHALLHLREMLGPRHLSRKLSGVIAHSGIHLKFPVMTIGPSGNRTSSGERGSVWLVGSHR